MLCRKIAFINCKGGVGKTSICVNIAAILARRYRKKVLVVDCDAQSSTSIWMMGFAGWLQEVALYPSKTVYAPFVQSEEVLSLSESIVRSPIAHEGQEWCESLDLIPCSYDWMDFDHEYQDQGGQPYYMTFYEHISAVSQNYDFIFFDCPPALGRASKCAIYSSDEFYVPTNPDLISGLGIVALMNRLSVFFQATQESPWTTLKYHNAVCSGLIYNRVPPTGNPREAKIQIQGHAERSRNLYPEIYAKNFRILKQEVRQYVAAVSSPLESSVPISLLDPNHNVSKDYAQVAVEIMNFKLQRVETRQRYR